ncbi:MAG TPA: cytochrome c-type biogenesis protein CcmH [Gemmatimonadales bacterium]
MMERREFLGLTAMGVLALLQAPQRPAAPPPPQDTLPDGGAAGQLPDPARAGRPLDPITALDNDAAIQKIEKRLRCTCGCGLDIYTCRTTDFTCTYSPALHRRVLALAASGLTGDQIVADFVQKNGIQMLMAPPKRGFNLAGYFTPSLVLLAAATILTLVLRRWTRGGAPTPPAAPAVPTASAAELDALQHALDRLDA